MNLFILSLYSKKLKIKEIMIIDNINNASHYYNVHPRFEEAFNFLKSLDPNSYTEGTIDVDGNNIKFIVSNNTLKLKEDVLLEAHRKYIDIHLPISQSETIGWKSIKTKDKNLINYDPEKDFELFNDTPTTYLTVLPGEFAVFHSEDAHAPLIGRGELKKLIFKIFID